MQGGFVLIDCEEKACDELQNISEIPGLRQLIGKFKYKLAVKIKTDDPEDIRILIEKIRAVEGVNNTVTVMGTNLYNNSWFFKNSLFCKGIK